MNPRRCAGAVMVAVLSSLLVSCGEDAEPVTVGLITKREDNPYWVAMRKVAEDVAGDEDVTLLTAAGEHEQDVAGQRAAMKEMLEAGVDGILIAPVNSTELLPDIEAAQEDGVVVIALDTATDPEDATDALFATDNEQAGELVGAYAAARIKELGADPQIAMLDLAPGISSGEQRHDGFLTGFGIDDDDEVIVGMVDTEGTEELGEEGLATLLEENPDINIVYTVNEPAATGALAALEAAGKDLDEVIVVSVDGSCDAVKGPVRDGDIDATAQQYPENMAREGVTRIAEFVRGGERPEGYLDTGVQLITHNEVSGVRSRDVAYGVRNCWGS